MKNHLIISILFTLILTLGSATAQKKSNLLFKIRAGYNSSTILTKNIPFTNKQFIPGFHIGAILEDQISEKFSLSHELIYSTQGAIMGWKNSRTGEEKSIRITLNYTNIPLMARFRILDRLCLEAGAYMGYLFLVKEKAGELKAQTITSDQYNSYDFGLGVGTSFDITTRIGITARYNVGLLNALPDQIEGISKNSTIQVGGTYKF